jgi:hypothetical protein
LTFLPLAVKFIAMKYCDLNCEYAEFPQQLSDGSLSCRTFIGLYCKKLHQIVPKNGLCLAELDEPRNQEKSENNDQDFK